MANLSRAEIEERITGLSWWHSIDLGAGVVTPGRWGPPAPIILAAMNDIDFKAASVLDVGCLDGLWSFEAERRGASEIIATDLVSQLNYRAQPTFEVARDILGSRARYFPDCSVFDVAERFGTGRFDVVIFAGVFYHLKDPLRALATLRRALKPGGVILVEGTVWDDEEEESYATFHYHDVFERDESNWWVPTIACLREWVECSFFELKSQHRSMYGGRRPLFGGIPPRTLRIAVTATAVERADRLYNCPDELLGSYDLNDYPWVPDRQVSGATVPVGVRETSRSLATCSSDRTAWRRTESRRSRRVHKTVGRGRWRDRAASVGRLSKSSIIGLSGKLSGLIASLTRMFE